MNPGESIKEGLIRELAEETGAQNIKVLQEFGLYEEFRPWYRPDFDMVHMKSYCYVCSIDQNLGETKFEDYEIKNGTAPTWINIHQAIAHNEEILKKGKQGALSTGRELYLLQKISSELLIK